MLRQYADSPIGPSSLASSAPIGSTSLTTELDDLPATLTANFSITVGEGEESESLTVQSRSGTTLTLASATTKAHAAGDPVDHQITEADANNWAQPDDLPTKSSLGLGNVDNTSDANKPISTATQTALNGKVGTTGDESITGAKTFENIAVGTNPELTAGGNNVSINADIVGITAGSSLQFSGAPPAFTAMGLYPNEAYAFNPGVTGGEILSSFLGGLYFLEPGTACTVHLRFDEAPFGLIIVRNDGAANLTLDIDPTSGLTMPATTTLTPGTFATFTPDHVGAIRRVG